MAFAGKMSEDMGDGEGCVGCSLLVLFKYTDLVEIVLAFDLISQISYLYVLLDCWVASGHCASGSSLAPDPATGDADLEMSSSHRRLATKDSVS